MEGRNRIQGALVLLISLMLWLGVGPVLSLLYLSWPRSGEGWLSVLQGYITVHIPFIALFLGLLLGARLIMGIRLGKLLSPRGFRWRYAAQSGLAYLLISILSTICHIGSIEPNGIPFGNRILFIIPVLLLTPMQAIAEETIFRALPARIAYGDTLPDSPLRALPFSVVSGLLFLIPHLGNPEVVLSEEAVLPMLYYFLWGAAAAYLAVETGGFEAPCAMHAVNNLYIALIVNYPDSAMPTEALLIDSTPASSITTLLYALLAFIVIHGLSVWRGYIEEGFRWQGRSRAGS